MRDWSSTPYAKWYAAHRRFSFTATWCLEQDSMGKPIPSQVFDPFLRSLRCHSAGEERRFQGVPDLEVLFKAHDQLDPAHLTTQDEKVQMCRSLLVHMRAEEDAVWTHLYENGPTAVRGVDHTPQ